MIKYLIIQVCCFGCREFTNILVSDDYIKSIFKLNNCFNFDYFIYKFDFTNYNLIPVSNISGEDLFNYVGGLYEKTK